MQPRLASTVLALVGMVMLAALLGCSHGNDYYGRDPYINGKKIDSSLASAEKEMAKALAAGETVQLISERTAPPFRARMVRFLHGYAGHPTAIASMRPGDDATADEGFVVTCRSNSTQHVMLTWGWFDGAWRAFPDYAITAADNPVEYPGCR